MKTLTVNEGACPTRRDGSKVMLFDMNAPAAILDGKVLMFDYNDYNAVQQFARKNEGSRIVIIRLVDEKNRSFGVVRKGIRRTY